MLGLVLRTAGAAQTGVVVSVLVGHTAWHWLQERWDTLERLVAVDDEARHALITSTALLSLVALNVASLVRGRASGDARPGKTREGKTAEARLP